MPKKKITIKDGFSCSVDTNAMDDMRVLDGLIAMEDPDSSAFEKIKAASETVTVLLGADGKKALYNYLEKRDGRVSVAEVTKTIGEVFGALGETEKK